MSTSMNLHDSRRVLADLVKSGMWSKQAIFKGRYRRLVVDAEAVVRFLCKQSMAINDLPDKRSPNYIYSASLINYVKFSRLVNKLLDNLIEHNIGLEIVYRGKQMEAPLFGLVAAEFRKNTLQVEQQIAKLKAKPFCQLTPSDLSRPNLALNIFKTIVNDRIHLLAGKPISIRVYQAYYHSYPLMAKLARDHKCPVLTNRGDFILMDVRAGFLLIDEFWSCQILSSPKDGSKISVKSNSIASHESRASSTPSTAKMSSPMDLHLSNTSRSRSGSKTPTGRADTCRFHLHSLFLHQHPGLTSYMALNLLPLATIDLVTRYSESLKRLGLHDSDFKVSDFVDWQEQTTSVEARRRSRRYQLAANRLETVLIYLASKSHEVMSSLIRSEATRSHNPFDSDYAELFNYFAVCYDFKTRLKLVLKQARLADKELGYIESSLLKREATSDYLLDCLCCSLGRLASVSYNQSIQFEDLDTTSSAQSVAADRSKQMLMSLFSGNKTHKTNKSRNMTNQVVSPASNDDDSASLTIIDRHKTNVAKRLLLTSHEEPILEQLSPKLQLDQLTSSKHDMTRLAARKFISIAFGSNDLINGKLADASLELAISKHFAEKELGALRDELRILLSLAAYTCKTFRDSSYQKLSRHLQVGLLNLYAHLAGKQPKLASLVTGKHLDLVVLINQHKPAVSARTKTGSRSSATGGQKSSARQKRLKSSMSASSLSGQQPFERPLIDKKLRHLIELLGAAIEAYTELNSFFNYPLTRLSLHLNYNPILLFNLSVLSLTAWGSESLIK